MYECRITWVKLHKYVSTTFFEMSAGENNDGVDENTFLAFLNSNRKVVLVKVSYAFMKFLLDKYVLSENHISDIGYNINI